MFKFDELIRIRALTFFAALVVSPFLLRAQEPSQGSVPTAPQAILHSFAAGSPSPSASGSTGLAPGAPEHPDVVYKDDKPTPEQLGDSLASHQRYQAAIQAYSQSTEHSAQLWNKMGIAYQMMFDVKDATRCYEESLKLDPHNARVLNNLATVDDSQKLYGKAEHLYHKALKFEPHSALILRNLGSNLMAQHKYKKGADTYREALAIDPKILEQHSGASVQNPTSVKDRGALHYYMAKGCMSAGNAECAIRNLRLAMNEGYVNAKKIAGDSGFASLHDSADFQQLIASQDHQ